MKIILFTFLLLLTIDAYGQPWYSKIIDPLHGKQESASIIKLDGDTMFVRANAVCSDNLTLCSEIGRYSITQNEIIDFVHYDNIQAGGKNLLFNADKVLLSSQEANLNKNISVTQVDKSTLALLNTLNLKVENPKYFFYTIKNSIAYNDKFILGAQASDSLMYIDLQGWFNFQESAIFFVLDSAMELATTLIIPPSSGAFLKIEDMAVGPDSILYITFFEKYLKHGTSQDYLEIHNVVYGFDKNYNIVFQWIGPDFENRESLSCIAINQNTTIYLNYRHDYHDYVVALNKDGSIKWECVLQPVAGINLHSISKLIVAENGDIIGTGILTSLVDDLGESGFIFRIDSNGNLKYKRAFRVNLNFDLTIPEGFPYQTGLEDIVELPGGDLMAVGYVRKYVGFEQPDGPHNWDIWILRTSSEGCLSNDCSFIQDIVVKDKYIPIVYAGNEWVVDAISPSHSSSLHRYSFSLDSVLLNGKYYFKLIYKSTIQGPWQETGRAMREENGRVFEFNKMDTSEILLYDFNFQIGDTLGLQMDGSINQRKVINVGSFKLADEIPRKSIMIECSSNLSDPDTTIWIEGMGDAERLFWTKTFCSVNEADDSIAAIRCFLMNDLWLYSRPDLNEDCYITSVNELEMETIKVYPNPVSDILHFELNGETPIERISIYDSVGKLTYSANGLSVGNTLDISQLSSGFYTGVIHFRSNQPKIFKLIVLDK